MIYVRFGIMGSWRYGIWWVRFFGRGYVIRAPWNPPLFSERYGHRLPIVILRGWRLSNFSVPRP